MHEFPKPVVIVSKCLGFEKCRYDGTMISEYFLQALQDYVDFIPVCPEKKIGL
ncbi:MAG: 2-thiouracil desulfurase family protein, partial [Bacteroidota bacterium]